MEITGKIDGDREMIMDLVDMGSNSDGDRRALRDSVGHEADVMRIKREGVHHELQTQCH